MTIKFLKQWGFGEFEGMASVRARCQQRLDGGYPITRNGSTVWVSAYGFICDTPGEAVKFAAALNKLRRPLHLIKQDLDKDWARRVKERDNQTCVLCGVRGDKVNSSKKSKDVLTAHHWLKTKSRAGMARWSRACGVTVHFAEHIHTLHENPCWLDLDRVYKHVLAKEGAEGICSAVRLVDVEATETCVRKLWLERCGNQGSRSV